MYNFIYCLFNVALPGSDVLAEALMEYQTLDGDMDDDCNVAVFDTITNLMEARVKKQLRQCRVSSSNVDCSTVCDAPSHGDDNTDVAVLQVTVQRCLDMCIGNG